MGETRPGAAVPGLAGAGPAAGVLQQVMDLLLQGPPNPDRFPALPSVMRQIAAAAARALNAHYGLEASLSFAASTMAAADELIADLSDQGVTVVVEAAAWQGRLVLHADAAFAGVLATALAGGLGVPAVAGDPSRRLTAIDVRLVSSVCATLLPVLEEGFAAVAPTPLSVVASASRLKADMLGMRGRDLIVSRFDVASPAGAGVLLLALPWTILADLGDAFAQGPREKPRAGDAGWQRQMGQEVVRAEVRLVAVLGRVDLSLGEISRLRPGQLVTLDPPRAAANAPGQVRIDCDGQSLFVAELGQAHGAYVLRITDFINEEREFLNGLFPG
jgi:flagellar motor switch protein FliM